MYRTHSRRKSFAKRYIHSKPASRIHDGACLILPLKKSNVAPDATMIVPRIFSRCTLIHTSCFGDPSPTQRKSGRALLIMSHTASSSSNVSGRKGGEYLPTTWIPSKHLRRYSSILSGASGAPPYRKNVYPRSFALPLTS